MGISCSKNDNVPEKTSNKATFDLFMERLLKNGFALGQQETTFSVSRGGDDDCDPFVSVQCHTISQINLNFTYTEPTYNCQITVPVVAKVCFDANGIPLGVAFEITGDYSSWTYAASTGCTALKNYWNFLFASNQIATLNSSLNATYKAITFSLESTYMTSFLNTYQVYCPARTLQANFTDKNCNRYCFHYEGEELGYIYDSYCGTACCRRRQTYCLNANGSLNITNTSYDTYGTCENSVTCESGDNYSTCNNVCDRL